MLGRIAERRGVEKKKMLLFPPFFFFTVHQPSSKHKAIPRQKEIKKQESPNLNED